MSGCQVGTYKYSEHNDGSCCDQLGYQGIELQRKQFLNRLHRQKRFGKRKVSLKLYVIARRFLTICFLSTIAKLSLLLFSKKFNLSQILKTKKVEILRFGLGVASISSSFLLFKFFLKILKCCIPIKNALSNGYSKIVKNNYEVITNILSGCVASTSISIIKN